MNLLIFFFAVLSVNCADAAGTGDSKRCVHIWKYNTYLEKKSCLMSYMGSVIKSTFVPTRRKRDTPAGSETKTNSTTSLPALPPPPSPDPISPPTKICLSLNEVEVLFKEKWKYIANKSAQNLTASKDFKNANEIRKEIMANLLQEKRLKEFKPEDFTCIKRTDIKKHLKEKCVINILKTSAHISKIPIRISNFLSKPTKIKLEEATCKNNIAVVSCVKEVLSNCSSTVQKFAGDLDYMMSKRCEPLLSLKTPDPVKKGMSTTVIVVIVLLSICASIVAGFGIYKFMKRRRNSGLHNVTRRSPEECEMTSRTK